MAFDVFISYSSKNNVIATAACAAIEAMGAHCWMAPRNIRPGRTYGEAIIDGMNECRILALIYSAYSNASPQVLREVERAVSKGLEIITVRVEDVPMSKALEYFLAAGHWLDGVGNDTEAAMAQLGSAVKLGLDHPDAHGDFLTAPAVDSHLSAPATRKAPATNLPAALTSFVGRATEKTDISEALVRSRIVTVTGPGGCGKTRVALEVAANNIDHYPGGIWYVDIDSKLGSVSQAILTAMRLTEEAGVDPASTIADAVADGTTLIVLDNCDQTLDEVQALATSLLRHAPGLKILATARAAIGVAGETVWPLAPFTPIDVEKLPRGGEALVEAIKNSDSVQLFVERAQSVSPSFDLNESNAAHVVAICNRLDGIPLAIELAAARTKVLSPDQIADRLSDQFRLLGGNKGAVERQHTLRATLDWSYNMLGDTEKVMLQRLSVFAGPASMEAVEAVCAGDPIDDWDVLDLLTGLVDKSLVLAEEWEGGYRYRMLQSVREYAGGNAEAGQLVDVSDRHLGWYLRVVEEADPNLAGLYQAAWLDRLDEDRANWLSALAWAEGQQSVDATKLAAAVSRFWMLRGAFNEASNWLGRIHDMAHASADRSPAYAKVLNALGTVAWNQGEIDKARGYFEESLALYRELGDTQRTADLLNNLGNLALDEGDEEKASALLEEALASYRSANDQAGISAALGNLALIALRAEDLAKAKGLYHESLTIDHSMGDSWAIATSLHALGVIASRSGEVDEAKAHLEDSLTRRVELGDHAGIAECIEAFGELALSNGHFERAIRLWGAASAIRESTGSTLPAADAAVHHKRIQTAAKEVGETTHTRLWNEGRLWSTEEAVRHARA